MSVERLKKGRLEIWSAWMGTYQDPFIRAKMAACICKIIIDGKLGIVVPLHLESKDRIDCLQRNVVMEGRWS